MTAKASAQSPNTVSGLTVYANGSNLGGLNFQSNNADGSVNYIGSFNLPQNVSDAPHPYQFILVGGDAAGNSASVVAGTVTVSNATPASVVNFSLSTTSLPASGGSVTINAAINVPLPNDVYDLTAFRFDSNIGGLSYASATGGNKNYIGSFTFAANVTDTPLIYPVSLRLRDNAGNTVVVPVGLVTVGAATPIKILSASASVSSLPAAGGGVFVTATVLAPAPNDVYDVIVSYLDANFTGLSYQSTNADGSKVYSGTFTVRSNVSNSVPIYDLVLRARDNAGNSVSKPIGNVSVASVTPISIVSAVISPASLPAAGGSVTVNATVNAPTPNDISYVRLYRYDSNRGDLTYVSSNVDGSKNYTGTFTVPANAANSALPNYYTLIVGDSVSNYAVKSLGVINQPAETPVTIVSAALVGAALPQTGGSVTVNAVISAPAPGVISSIRAYIYGGSAINLNYLSTNADGTFNYSGAFNVGANSAGSVARKYFVSVEARDNAYPSSNYAYAYPGVISVGSVASVAPISFVKTSVSTNMLPAAGGNVVVNVTIKTSAANTVNFLDYYANGFYIGRLNYLSTNADGTINYTASYAAPANNNNYNYSFQVFADNNDGDITTALAGVVTEAAYTPVHILSKSVTVTGSAASTDVVFNAVVSVPSPNYVSNFYAYRNGSYYGRLNYISTNADGTQNWSASYNIGANSSGAVLNDVYSVLVQDAVSNYEAAVAGTSSQGTIAPPVLASSNISATSFPTQGGYQTISAVTRTTNPNYITALYAYVNNAYIGRLAYLYDNADGSQNWIGSFAVAANGNDASRSDVYSLLAVDRINNEAALTVGMATVAGQTPLTIKSASLSATSFPAAGGDEIINAKIAVPAGNTVQYLNVYRNAQYIGRVNYQSTNADGSQNYLGSYSVPGNVSDLPRTDCYYLLAYDSENNYVTMPFGNVTVGPATPVSITQATLSTATLTVNGGDVIINATTAAPTPNDTNNVAVYSNGQYIGNLGYQNRNADGTRNYLGSFHIGANGGATRQAYLYTLIAADNASNLALDVLGAVSVDSTPATVAGRVALEAEVAAAAAQTVTFQFRPKDGSATFNQSASIKPDGFFNLTNIPRKDYDLWIKGPKNLAKVVAVNTLNSDAHSVTALLPGGDANNDNSVDTTDFGVLVGVYGSDITVPGSGYDATADFNGDGSVDTTDFGILVGNYNAVGDI